MYHPIKLLLRLNIFTKRKIIDQKISIFRNGLYSSEKNLSTVLILGLKFCSASIIISLPAYLTLIEDNTLLYKLNFFPSGVIMISSITSNFSASSHLVFLQAFVQGISFSLMISLTDFAWFPTESRILIISSSAKAVKLLF